MDDGWRPRSLFLPHVLSCPHVFTYCFARRFFIQVLVSSHKPSFCTVLLLPLHLANTKQETRGVLFLTQLSKKTPDVGPSVRRSQPTLCALSGEEKRLGGGGKKTKKTESRTTNGVARDGYTDFCIWRLLFPVRHRTEQLWRFGLNPLAK